MLRIFIIVIIAYGVNGYLEEENEAIEDSEYRLVPLKLLRLSTLENSEQNKEEHSLEESVADDTPWGQPVKECRPNFCCHVNTECCGKWYCCGKDPGYNWRIIGWWCDVHKSTPKPYKS